MPEALKNKIFHIESGWANGIRWIQLVRSSNKEVILERPFEKKEKKEAKEFIKMISRFCFSPEMYDYAKKQGVKFDVS